MILMFRQLPRFVSFFAYIFFQAKKLACWPWQKIYAKNDSKDPIFLDKDIAKFNKNKL